MTSPEERVRRTVLIVDDEAGMRYMARRVLETRYEVVEAGSGEEAIDRFGERTFHVALVDLRLPGQSGLELLSAIKVMSPSTDVVIMTGSTKDPDEALLGSIRRKAFFFLRKPFSASLLETLVDRITETQLLEERLQQSKRTLEEDLESARVFQQGLLPPRDWTGRGITAAGLYIPSARLSGDLIDYWTLPAGGTALLAADIEGHGASAAMMTGIVKTHLRTLAQQDTDPAQILEGLDGVLRSFALSRFLTIFLVIDDGTEIRYCGAGHPAGILSSPDGSHRSLESEGIPLNVSLPMPRSRRTSSEPRHPGSRLFLHTDGFADAESPSGARFSETAAYETAITEALELPPPTARAHLEDVMQRHTHGMSQEDDRAFLIAELR
jgi:sigma-B regulation protein RsbU (phosphoserine phosphatase)